MTVYGAKPFGRAYMGMRKPIQEKETGSLAQNGFRQVSLLHYISPNINFITNTAVQKNGIKFGFDPLTWLGLSLGGICLGKCIDYVIGEVKGLCTKKKNSDVDLALEYLELSRLCDDETQRNRYLEKAESKLLKAAVNTRDLPLKIKIHKNLVIISHLLNRGLGVTDKFIDTYIKLKQKYREIQEQEKRQTVEDYFLFRRF